MNEDLNEELFGFNCPHCGADIEVSKDLLGTNIECPACGQKIVVPGGSSGATPNQEPTPAMLNAQKSRTIRIDLGSLF